MDEVLEKFLEDQKSKIAEEKASLEQEPPYMEMRRRTGHVLQKENIPPRTSQQDGVSLQLGEEYERKKHKLQEELRNDYRKYKAEKDHREAGDIHTVPERRRIPRTVRVRDVATLTEVCGLGWGVCSSEEDCSEEELMLLQGRRHQRERDTRTANRGELFTDTGHQTSKLQHRNRMSTSVVTQANERSVSVASRDTVCTTGLLIGAVGLEGTLQRKKERYRHELQEQIAEKQSHRRREKELDLRVSTDAKKKQLFVSEASAYRKQPRDDIIRLDTAEPPEGVLQYRTDSLSPCRMPFVPTQLPFLTDAYKTPNNDAESPSRAYCPIMGVSFSTSSGEPHPLSPHSRSTHRQRIVGENEVVGSGLLEFPAHHAKTDRLSYKEELRKQIEDRAAQRRVDREEKHRLEAELEADMRAYEPWGRGGAGAPLRDSTGNLITDLKQMHLLNVAAAAPPQRPERPGFVETHTPQFARGNVFNQIQSPQLLLEQDQYKAYLRHQIEEKRRKQAEESERTRAEEEREDRRLAEQREKIRREYEEEQESRKRRELEQKLKNEELARLVEERRRDAEKKKKEEEEKERAAVRKQETQERQIRLQQVQRAPSPPIPTLQNKYRNPSNATDFSALRAPPSPESRNNQRTEKDRSEVVNELCALRRRLRSEQRRLEEQLLQTEWEHFPSPFTDRHRTDVFDMARLRMPVRGPSARGTEPISSKGADDIMYRDAFMPLPRTWQSRNRDVEGGRGSVLLSESEFIDQNGIAFPVPPDVERKSAKQSARERRRLANLQSAERKPVQQQSFNMRKLRDTNTPRMKGLQAFSHHNTTAGDSDDDDEANGGEEHFTLQSPGRPSSIDTATTEPWIRAESSDTLRRLMSASEL
ncbi:centrosome and spindle pole-associated protein 1 isoform X2 [Sinocyclocheilus anshuiensis]|uniref:centrosome and spindle pole-associated protein 1 isoform X2 n=1 Tax=Sinocyclocheilus anshuiensis TaxID=1608454 RepID=UPI0007B7EFFC|nr:PREDICTED: centrosome and spindle pole-associated protein 1-like isoform X2 [Sinocyclocheilus anshuiensis]